MVTVPVVVRQFGQKVWRHTSLTVKALFSAVLLGSVFWVAADYWQTIQVEGIFQKKMLHDLEIQAQRDRTLFDHYISQQEQSVRMISFLTPLAHYVAVMAPQWAVDPGPGVSWVADNRPPWLPPRSTMRGLVAAPYVILLDAQQRVRETFFRETGLPPLSVVLLERVLPELLIMGEHSHIVADPDGVVYLVTLSGVQDQDLTEQKTAIIVMVAPLNNDFLSIFHSQMETSSVVVFVHGETNRVFASSQPDKIAVGIDLEQLKTQYIVFGKKFLDYSFSINIPIHFATLVPVVDISQTSNAILTAERQQRTTGYAILGSCFLVLVVLIIRSIQSFTENMIDASIKQLGLKRQQIASGDQLLVMRERFGWMTQQIVHARDQEKLRQAELQMVNDALHQSLLMVKRTQSQLVEAEKMASLGSLVAGVAHEINTPVGTSVTAASFLEQRSQECAARFASNALRKSDLESFFGDVLESTQLISYNLRRAAELVKSFKQVAVDRVNEERRLFHLDEYIRHTLHSLRPHLKKTRHTVTVQCPEALEIDSYPGAFSQIITNFVVNSLVHGFQEQEEGEILFQVVRTADGIRFCYADNGRGMEEKDRLRVFEPFFTTARQRGGSGLGLHIVFNLVTQTLKGTILCVSRPGQGTRYEIDIPVE